MDTTRYVVNLPLTRYYWIIWIEYRCLLSNAFENDILEVCKLYFVIHPVGQIVATIIGSKFGLALTVKIKILDQVMSIFIE